ncbi:MAG: hypothetical protein ACI8RY_000424 [Urechidicola sp.]|jgi:hypothetical protein
MKYLSNILSVYRLLMFPPLLILLMYENEETLFLIIFVISILIDIIYKWILIKLNVTSKYGYKLDLLASIGCYFLAVIAISNFHWNFFYPFKYWFYSFLLVYLFAILFSLIKFKGFPRLHINSLKIVGFAQVVFLALLFVYQFIPWIFIIAMAVGIIIKNDKIASITKLKVIKSKSNIHPHIKIEK